MSGITYRNRSVGPSFQLYPDLSAPPHSEGLLFYDREAKCPAYFNDTREVTNQIGRELWKRATNKTGITIPDGTLVYVSGAQGNRATMAPAKADSPTTSRILAMATHAIENNMTGEFTTFGEVHGLDTAGIEAGTSLYLSDTIAGAWTTTPPSPPNFPIHVGIVTRENADDGIIDLSIGPTDVVGQMVIQMLALNAQLNMAEITTPTAIPNYGAVYFKADNKLYAQDGAGVEYEVAFVP